MKKLSRQQAKDLSAHVAALEAGASVVNGFIQKLNQLMEEAGAELADAVEAYNATAQEFNSFREEVHGDMENYFDEKSEKWQEGDVGQDFSEWMARWETEVDEIEVEIPEPMDEIEMPDMSEYTEEVGL